MKFGLVSYNDPGKTQTRIGASVMCIFVSWSTIGLHDRIFQHSWALLNRVDSLDKIVRKYSKARGFRLLIE